MKLIAGKRVLLVEDEPIVAMDVEDMLLELGFEVKGPYLRLSAALEAAATENIDLAVLDINLNGEESYPAAQALRDRSVPFIFATGYGQRETPFSGTPILAKPYRIQELEAALLKALES